MSDLLRWEKILDGFTGARMAVIGDFVADVFIYGRTKRVSREAPVLVLEYQGEKHILGGAANAVHNARMLGTAVVPIGILGRDEAGAGIRKAFSDLGLKTDFVLEAADRPTTTKQRIVGSGLHTTFQQMLRLDRGRRDEIDAETEQRLLLALDEISLEIEILIVSDYDYGVLSPNLIEKINAIAKERRVKVMIDSRYRIPRFRRSSVMTPNEPEAEEAAGMTIRTDEDVLIAGRLLLKNSESDAVLITRGRRGMALFPKSGQETLIPIFGTDEIADVTGAGDTVIATFAAAVGAGAAFLEAAILANVAGGLVVMKSGTATVTVEEIREAIRKEDPWPDS